MTVEQTTPVVGAGVPDTAPYPWPWDGAVDPSRLALVIAGARRYGQGGSRADDVCRRIVDLATVVRAAGGLVVHVHHTGTDDGPAQVDLSSRLSVDPADVVVTAAGVDGFYGSSLDLILRRSDRVQLALVGFGLETAVHSTMRSANDQGYECLLLTDACLAHDPDLEAAAISMVMMSGGIFGAVGSASNLMATLIDLKSLTAPVTPPPGGPRIPNPAPEDLP